MATENNADSSELSSSTSSFDLSDEEDTTGSNSESEDDSTICSLCRTISPSNTRIEDCNELQSIRTYIETTSPTIKKVRYACQTCLYKLYMIIDQNRIKAYKAEREQRLAAVSNLIHSSNAQSYTSSVLPRPGILKNSSQPSTAKESCAQDNENQPNGYAEEEENAVNGAAQNKHTEELEDRDADSQTQSKANRNDGSIIDLSSSHSHLDVMYEQSESALITESGGTLDQYKNPPLQCRYCSKNFVLQKPYYRHMRSHQGKLFARSAASNRSRSVTSNIVYACTDCSATFNSSSKLKNHSRIHLKRYYCTYCHKENFNLFAHDFHEAECKGKQLAKDGQRTNGRITRSFGRSERGGQEKISKNAKSLKSFRSKNSNANAYCDNDQDDDDDATSVAYTDFTAVNNYVENWVAGTCHSEYESRFHTRTGKQSMDPQPVVVSQKEYDIIMLERLLLQADRNVYSCWVLNCDYVTNTLRELCLHEVVIHKFKTFYTCRKCGGSFTSKLYLDYHLYMQNYGEYHCNKCTLHFDYEYQLQYHLLQHQQNEAFPCHYCSNSFMSNHELRIHCIETGHDPKKIKPTISIEKRMTIVNETVREPPPPKKTYTCIINIMNLQTNTKRRRPPSTRFKGKKIFLGDIDFQYDPGWNCVQTK